MKFVKCNDGNTGNKDINDIVENFDSSACIEHDCGDDIVVGIGDHNDVITLAAQGELLAFILNLELIKTNTIMSLTKKSKLGQWLCISR